MSFDRTLATRQTLAGNDAYAQGDYGAAIAAYRAALEAGADSSDLHYNLGNAYYRAGQTGRAALAYERALRRDPSDAEAQANLELVRAQSGRTAVDGGPLPFLTRLGAATDPDLAASMLLGSWLFACALFIAWMRLRGRVVLRTILGIAAGISLLGAAALGVALWASDEVRSAGWAVVVEAGEVREAPDPQAAISFPLEAAARVRIDSRIGGYAKIELPNGLGGWIEASRVEPIDPVD